MIEFTMVGIPLMFVLISIVEMSRGMWIYHSLAHAVKEGARYTIVHGQNYTAITGSSNTIQNVCNVIVNAGPGLISTQLSLTFTSDTTNATYTANNCPTTAWPPGATGANPNIIDNEPGENITITATYPFQSAISMFWPGKTKGMQVPTITFPAGSTEMMQF
jgi:Flp pilus assembly protein TadG